MTKINNGSIIYAAVGIKTDLLLKKKKKTQIKTKTKQNKTKMKNKIETKKWEKVRKKCKL